MDTMLKKREILRDSEGRFERHGEGLIKKHEPVKKSTNSPINNQPVPTNRIGRPKGSKNKLPMQLRELVLESLDRVGGVEYLSKLAYENSSAYASLLGKVLGNTQPSQSDGGVMTKIEFRRVIVYAKDQQLPAPSSHALPDRDVIEDEAKEINDLDA